MSSADNPGGQNNNQNGSSHQNSNAQPIEFKSENNCIKEENNNKIKTMKNGHDMDAIVHNNSNNNNNVSSVSTKLCPNGGSVIMSANPNQFNGSNGFQGVNHNDNNNNNNDEHPNGVSTSTSIVNITPLNQKGIFLQHQQQHQQNVHSSGNTNIVIQGRLHYASIIYVRGNSIPERLQY